MNDLKHAARQLRKSPGFTTLVVLTLTLGIGTNTAIFTLIHAVLLKSLPVTAPRELYSLGDSQICCDSGAIQDSFTLYSYPLYQHLRDHETGFTGIAAFRPWLANLSVRRGGTTDPAQAGLGEIVSGNYFGLLGVSALRGRLIGPDDDRRGSPKVAVVSHRAWSQYFGMDSSVIGSSISINGASFTIVGVAPMDFYGETMRGDPPDFWLPLSQEPEISRDNPLLDRSDVFWLYAIGRLRSGAQLPAIEARLNAEIHSWLLGQGFVADRDRARVASQHMTLTPAGGGVAGVKQEYGRGLQLLVVISAFVLGIACVNVASLLLSRSVTARADASLRVALGASRGDLVRQTMVSALLLALLGGATGIAAAYAGARAILGLVFHHSNFIPVDVAPSWMVLGFGLGVSLLTTAICGTIPAWLGSRTDPIEALRGVSRSTGTRSALPHRLFIVVQSALSLVLLASAGLLTESLQRLQGQPFGFETSGRMIVRLNPALAGYTAEQLPGLYRKLDESLPRIPGVLDASYALHTPMDDWNWGARLTIEGRPAPASPANQDRGWYNRVSPHFFDTIGTRVLRGRGIDNHDIQSSRHVAVVNETFAARYFPKVDPVGRHFGMGDLSHVGDYEIVGIVQDTKYRRADAPVDAMFFLPLTQFEAFQDSRLASYQRWSLFIDSIQLRVAASSQSIEPLVRRALADIDPKLGVLGVRTFGDQVSDHFNSPRMVARLSALFAMLALVLGCVGAYGMAAQMVARRTSEIGIRVALGADRANLLRMILRQAMAPVTIGMGIGLPFALVAGYAMRSQLFGVKGSDPAVLTASIAAMVLATSLAALIPARRAASIDPIRALRDQ